MLQIGEIVSNHVIRGVHEVFHYTCHIPKCIFIVSYLRGSKKKIIILCYIFCWKSYYAECSIISSKPGDESYKKLTAWIPRLHWSGTIVRGTIWECTWSHWNRNMIWKNLMSIFASCNDDNLRRIFRQNDDISASGSDSCSLTYSTPYPHWLSCHLFIVNIVLQIVKPRLNCMG